MKKKTKIIIVLVAVVVLLLSILAIAAVSNRMDDKVNEGFINGVYELAYQQTANDVVYYLNESMSLNSISVQQLCGVLNE